jgi:uncharacterized membrane protein HdeD (DUF308 family)
VSLPRVARVVQTLTAIDVRAHRPSLIPSILLGIVYLMALVFLGMATLRKGHTALFFFGLFLPFLWIVGAMSQPTQEVARLQ